MIRSLQPKHQRLVLLVFALAAIIGAGLLASYALQNQASYFYTPEDIAANRPAPDQDIRLGGMVETGSMVQAKDGITVNFIVQDGVSSVPVTFTGIVPDLFVEGSGVVAEGTLRADGVFVASNLLAKHDENYMPRELEGMSAEQKRDVIEGAVK